MDREKKKYISILFLALLLVWVINDFILVKEKVFQTIEQYSFKDKSFVVVKEKVKQEIKRLQTAGNLVNSGAGGLETADQLLAMVHMTECNYYLLLNRQKSLERYYDFIKLVLYPPQRRELREKSEYVKEMKRHLKRKKNLKIRFTDYTISSPVVTGTPGRETAEVLVMRIMVSAPEGVEVEGEAGKEYVMYRFRRHTDKRYYLYFTDSFFPTRMKLEEAGKTKNEN
jgi:formyltetrahydrofolate synthetase